jgi:putative transposase
MKQLYLMCGISKQAHHKALARQKGQIEKEALYVRLMEQTREIHPGMGLRTMYELHQPEGIGRDAFIALGLREGFRLKAVEKFVRTTYNAGYVRYGNLLVGKVFTDVNQLWSSDITYLYCLGRFYYIVLLIDVYSRRILGYSLADNMRAENNVKALGMALSIRGRGSYNGSLIHHSDKGSQYASDIYTDMLQGHGIEISMCDDVYENTHIERVNDTIKNQYLNRMHIKSESDLKQKLDQVVHSYNTTRPHKSLMGMSPVDYEGFLKTVPGEKRHKMEIYTINRLEKGDPNQLKIMFN